MKIHINNPVHSTKMRVLSAFLAFLIFTLTFQEALVGWGGIRVKAADANTITGNTKVSKVVSNGTTGSSSSLITKNGSNLSYTYTGKIKTADSWLYDYKADANTSADSYGYTDIYTNFNTAISQDNTGMSSSASSLSANNVTFKVRVPKSANVTEVRMHLKKSSSDVTTYPGYTMKRDTSYSDSTYERYIYTVPFAKVDGVKKIEFSGRKDNKGQDGVSTGWQANPTDFDIGNSQKGGTIQYYFTEIKNFWPSNNNDNEKSTATYDSWTSTGAETINNCRYSYPLYFGCFYLFGSYYDSDAASTSQNYYNDYGESQRQKKAYKLESVPNYNNFFWQLNLGQKTQNASYQLTNGDASVQNGSSMKVVDETIQNSKLTQGGKELPYFNADWASSHSSVMTAYDKTAFPFYEILTDAKNIKNNNVPDNSTDKVRFYQFNSSETNLRFVTSDGAYAERAMSSKVKSQGGNAGFFPFNDSSASSSDLNLGFGSKFEMTFKLNEDGTVDTLTSDGKAYGEGLAKKVHTLFEFTGDDDLWVYIDGNLVLDLGGVHDKTTGYIDFADGKAVASKALTFGSGSNTHGTGNDLFVSSGVGEKTVSGSTFANKIADATYNSSTGKITYNPGTRHTMTVFYMERGMFDSNLMIRFNYALEHNFSKMKVREVTDFTSVNEGLLNATKLAAEDDVFQYTVQNESYPDGVYIPTESDNVGVLYPTYNENVRTNSGVSTTLTKNSASTMTFTTPNFTNSSSPTNGIYSNVGGVSYVWVDKFASLVGSDRDKIGEMTNITDSEGKLSLMYGTSASESSAEFQGQFRTKSNMKVKQEDNLAVPNRTNTNTPATFSVSSTPRKVSDYYTSKVSLYDASSEIVFLDKTLDEVNNQPYIFQNVNQKDILSSTTNSDELTILGKNVMMTETFTNTVNTGTLIVKKVVSGQSAPADSTEYTFNLQLKNVFGVANNDVDNYSSIAVTKTAADSSPSSVTLDADGTFKLKKGEQISIRGVPVGTRYIVTETGTNNATVTGEVKPNDAEKTIAAKNGEYTVTVTNTFPDFQEIGVEKTDETNHPLSGAELELWYKETVTPPTYSFNEEPIAPFKKNGMKIDTTVGVPGLAELTETTHTYTENTTYNNPATPNAQDKDWILPRSDSDYIYFRDYNSANNTSSGGYIGDKDKTSFGSSNKVAWRETFFAEKSAGTHHQVQEIGFSNQSEWIAAQFTKNGGKDMVQYAVWERFVDNYNGTNTVVWKIQPPDGYTEVRFCLYDGDNCIRTTERFNYELGKIYHKTNWGTYYSDANGGSYWDVPVTAESNNNGYWAPTTSDTSDQDQRMTGTITGTNGPFTYTGQMTQPKKYEPTDQKIIFHCNSAKVWHNIHIQFFTDEDGNNRVNGQPFPGYMMEPYAYAGSDYRMRDGYLTYELTIPKDAVSFQINNGVSSGDYAFKTEVKKLYTATLNGSVGSKNYGNYFCLGNYETNDSNTSTDNPKNDNLYTLTDWSAINDTPTATYPTVDVDSDYDYIYFEKPTSNWNGHVYAYFYGGGNLRADNWQRACYSAWPGVAAAGTEYKTFNTSGTQSGTYASTTYSYSIENGNAYTATGDANVSNPDTKLTLNNKTIYKFRIPKGDRTNYSKVIFNDGLKSLASNAGSQETGVIAYKPGYLYNKDGQETKHYENGPTVTYTATTGVSGATEYLYIKMANATASTWDDPHITFYDSNGTQILQGGCGYVMDYAGKDSTNTYFKVPIPNDAKKFSVNNGIGTSATGLYDIERLTQTSGAPKATAENGDKFVYTLSGSALTRDGYSKTMTQSTATTTTVQSEDTTNYGGVRQTGGTDDVLALRDKANWNAPINGITVRFYDAGGAVIGSGSYNMMVTNADGDGYKWYTKKIPTNAAAFDVTYITNSTTNVTPKYPIYPATTADANGNVTTTGDMYYETVGTNTLSVYNAVPSTTEADDETYAKRGDYLYLIYASKQSSAPKVTFKAGNGAVIKSNVTAKYLNEKDNKHWYKISIPEGAASFEVGGQSGEIYELKKTISRYEQGYTIGDMQYEVTGGSLECKYPIFTKDTDYELTVSDGKTISSRDGAAVVDASAVSQYANADTAPLPTTNSTLDSGVVVHDTTTDNITYTWSEGSGEKTKIRLNKESWFSDARISFNGGSSYTNMTLEDSATYISGDIPSGATTVTFQLYKGSSWVTTDSKTLPSDIATKNYKYSVTYTEACNYDDYLIVYGDTSIMQTIRILLVKSDNTKRNNYFEGMQSGLPSNSGITLPTGKTASYTTINSSDGYVWAIVINDDSNPGYWCAHIQLTNGGGGQVFT